MIILHSHLQPQFKNELFHILHILTYIFDNKVLSYLETRPNSFERVPNMHADGTFETERHHEDDDESMSEETEEEEKENVSKGESGESSETSEDGHIEQSFEVMFISDKDIRAQVNT